MLEKYFCVSLGPPTTTTTTTPGGACSIAGEDCRTTGCCAEPGFSCYEKNECLGLQGAEDFGKEMVFGCLWLSDLDVCFTHDNLGVNQGRV